MDEITKQNIELHFQAMELDELARDVAIELINLTATDGAHHKRYLLRELANRILTTEQVIKGFACPP